MLALFAGCFALYATTLTGVHTFDAYSYASAVQTKPWRETFHPHHLLYGPMGALAFSLGRSLGVQSPFLALQLVNVLAGSLGVAAWFSILDWLLKRRDLALLGALSLLVMYAWWYYAVEVEVYTLATLFLIVAFGILLRLIQQPTWRNGWLWLGVAHSGAMLFHQTNVLWGIVVVVGWLMANWQTTAWRERWSCFARYLVAGMIIVGGLYAVVMFGLSGFRTWNETRAWLFEYAATGFWGGAISGETVLKLGRGWRNTITGTGGGLILLASLGLVMLMIKQTWQRWRREIMLALVWIVVYTLFFGWWEADNIEFWIGMLPAWILLVMLTLHELNHTWQRWAIGAWAISMIVIGIINGTTILRRGDPATDADRQVVTAVAALGTPEDLYVVPNGLQELYLRYEFNRPNVLALSIDNGNWEQGCTTIRNAISTTTNAGYNVWIDDGVRNPSPELLQRYRLNRDAVVACFAPFAAGSERSTNVARYYVLNPVPQGEPDWRWRDWTLGWQANFIRDTQWNDGWSFVSDNDPHLLTPRITLQASDWRSLEITMATTIPNQRGQFYWIEPSGSATEDRSVTWDIIADGAMHTYTLDLASNPNWNGTIGLLRIDPVGSGDGDQRVIVQRVRLVK